MLWVTCNYSQEICSRKMHPVFFVSANFKHSLSICVEYSSLWHELWNKKTGYAAQLFVFHCWWWIKQIPRQADNQTVSYEDMKMPVIWVNRAEQSRAFGSTEQQSRETNMQRGKNRREGYVAEVLSGRLDWSLLINCHDIWNQHGLKIHLID